MDTTLLPALSRSTLKTNDCRMLSTPQTANDGQYVSLHADGGYSRNNYTRQAGAGEGDTLETSDRGRVYVHKGGITDIELLPFRRQINGQ